MVGMLDYIRGTREIKINDHKSRFNGNSYYDRMINNENLK